MGEEPGKVGVDEQSGDERCCPAVGDRLHRPYRDVVQVEYIKIAESGPHSTHYPGRCPRALELAILPSTARLGFS